MQINPDLPSIKTVEDLRSCYVSSCLGCLNRYKRVFVIKSYCSLQIMRQECSIDNRNFPSWGWIK